MMSAFRSPAKGLSRGYQGRLQQPNSAVFKPQLADAAG